MAKKKATISSASNGCAANPFLGDMRWLMANMLCHGRRGNMDRTPHA